MIIVIFKMRRLRLRKTGWPPRVTRLVVGDQDVEPQAGGSQSLCCSAISSVYP